MEGYRESHARSAAKAISYRILGTVASTMAVFALTGRWGLALSLGSFELLFKIALFWVHERIWDRLPYGRTSSPVPRARPPEPGASPGSALHG